MEVVKAFNDELSSLYETKPPISKAKMTSITRTAIKAIKFYKHVVQSVEKFIQKCKPEYKVPGLYVIDSIVRQSRHQFGTEKDVFAPRFARNLKTTFSHLFNCPPEDKSKVIRVLNLWQKNSVFEADIINPLFDLADPSHPIHKEQASNTNAKSGSGVTPQQQQQPAQVNRQQQPLPNVDVSSQSWIGGAGSDMTGNNATSNVPLVGSAMLQQLKQLQNILLNQTASAEHGSTPVKKDNSGDQVKFDKKLLDFDYGDDEDDEGKTFSSPQHAPPPNHQQQQQQQMSAIDSLGSILCNPEVLRQLQNLQLHMSQQQLRQQQTDLEEKMRKLQEMKQQEEEFDKHLAQTLPSLPFANECDFKLNAGSETGNAGLVTGGGGISHQALMQQYEKQHQQQAQEISAFKGGVGVVDISQPPPGYPGSSSILRHQQQQQQASAAGAGSPLEDGERANSDVDDRHAGIRNWVSDAMIRSQNLNRQQGREGGSDIAPVVVIDSESPSESPNRSGKRHRSRYSRSSSRSRSRRHDRDNRSSRSRSRSSRGGAGGDERSSRSSNKRRRSRSYERERDYEKEWDKDKPGSGKQKEIVDKERERERKKKGLPTLKKNHLAVCSTTLWVGHLSKLVQQEELSDTFGEYGDIVSIDLIPPRGCAFVCMNRRQDAFKALQNLKYHKLQGKALTMAWAPGKGMKGKEWKDYWEVEQGVSYIPWSKINAQTDMELLEEGGTFDEDSFPAWLKHKLDAEKQAKKASKVEAAKNQDRNNSDSQQRSQDQQPQQQQQQQKQQQGIGGGVGERNNVAQRSQNDATVPNEEKRGKEPELDIPIPAPTLPGFIPLPDGPQPDLKVNVNAPPMGLPPMGMLPPFGHHLPSVPRLMGPMGMPMGPGLMPSGIPLGVPPPGLHIGSPLAMHHQQMMHHRMPQPVNSPFNPPPHGVGLMGGPPPPPLSQIPLPGTGADKPKPMGVPPPASDLSGFTDPLLQMPFSLPPQLQLSQPGSTLHQHQLQRNQGQQEQQQPKLKPASAAAGDSDAQKEKKDEGQNTHPVFTHLPPNFPPNMSGLPPNMQLAPPQQANNDKEDDDRMQMDVDKEKEDRESGGRDKDMRGRRREYRDSRDRDRRGDYRERSSRGRDSYRERDYERRGGDSYRRERDSRKDRSSRERGDVGGEEEGRMRPKDEEGKKNRERESDDGDSSGGGGGKSSYSSSRKDRDKSRAGDKERQQQRLDRERGPGGGSRWADRRKDDSRAAESLPDDKSWNNGSNNAGEENNSQKERSGGAGAEMTIKQDGPRSLLDMPQIAPPDGAGLVGGGMPPPPPPGIGMLGPPPPPPQMVVDGHPPPFPPPGGLPPPPHHMFGVGGRSGPPDGGGFCLNPDDFDIESGPPPNFSRGPPIPLPPRGHPNNRPPLVDMFEPRGPPRVFDQRGPPLEGFEPRIRIEFFPRGRGMRPDGSFGGPRTGMMARGPAPPMGPIFSPRGPGPMGIRGPRPGIWMEGGPPPPQGGPGPGFPPPPPRGFLPPPDGPPPSDEFNSQRGGGGGGGRTPIIGITRGPMRGGPRFQAVRTDRKGSRWSNASPPPAAPTTTEDASGISSEVVAGQEEHNNPVLSPAGGGDAEPSVSADITASETGTDFPSQVEGGGIAAKQSVDAVDLPPPESESEPQTTQLAESQENRPDTAFDNTPLHSGQDDGDDRRHIADNDSEERMEISSVDDIPERNVCEGVDPFEHGREVNNPEEGTLVLPPEEPQHRESILPERNHQSPEKECASSSEQPQQDTTFERLLECEPPRENEQPGQVPPVSSENPSEQELPNEETSGGAFDQTPEPEIDIFQQQQQEPAAPSEPERDREEEEPLRAEETAQQEQATGENEGSTRIDE